MHSFSQPIYSLFSHLISARRNLGVILCLALKILQSTIRFFIKVTRSFVAIELLNFLKNAKFHVIAEERSHYLGYLNYIPQLDQGASSVF